MKSLNRVGLLCALVACVAVAAEVEVEGFGEDITPGPAETVTSFLKAAHDGRFEGAAQWLSLDAVEPARRAEEGPRLARRFMFLLDQFLTFDAEKLTPTEGSTVVTVGDLPMGRVRVPVQVSKQADGAWRFSTRTVRAIDTLYAENGSPVWELLPPWLMRRTVGPLGAWQWLGLLAMFGLGWLASRISSAVLQPLMKRLTKLSDTDFDDKLVARIVKPVRLFLFLIAMAIGTRALAFPMVAQSWVDDLVRAGLVASVVWALLVVGGLVAEVLEARAAADEDFRSARAVKTQVAVLRRVATAIILIVGGALVLLQFPAVRHIGMSLLASAGVAGVVLGLAAQRTLGNLLAGIQIGLTQPMRIGDTVIVEGEWGWIEEITLTYVVVKVWDLRRLVLPISYFLEKPFQNWSRTSTEILGTIEVWADYRVDVAAARAELLRIVEPERGKLWNGKTAGLVVTNATDRAILLRGLVSCDDSGKLWDLRCLVREKMIAWLQQQPEGLPKLRAEGVGDTGKPLRAGEAV